MSALEERIRRGLGADVTFSADDIISAAAARAQRSRRQQRWAVGIGAAAAVLTVTVGVLAVVRGNDTTAPPVGPSPSPTPSVTYESPGPGDHPIGLYDGDGALTLITIDRFGSVGIGTVWQKQAGGWRRLGTIEHAIPPEQVDPGRTHLSPGPGSGDFVALDLAGGRVGFSRDGGATWSYLAKPAGCAEGGCSEIFPTTDYLYVNKDGTALRAAFGAATWEEISVPWSPGSQPDRSLLPLEDALLNIDSDCDATTNHYWVSRDDGDTWGERQDFPAGTCIYERIDNTAYTADADETQWWLSTDLVQWELALTSPYDEHARQAFAACPGSLGKDRFSTWLYEPPVRIGDEVYKIVHLSNRDGRKLELRVSHDDCHTWKPVL